jgi:hypothetical protein
MTSAIQDNLKNAAAVVPVGVRQIFIILLLISHIFNDKKTQGGSYPEIATNFRYCQTEGLPCVVDVCTNIFVYQ